ncbi:MAG: DNA methyltransferase [Anaerolineaceae bacterium]|nr:DNA methyltransferase [Anaerolineaceae bacterium]MDE0329438.1 DNA methyltransferase [Anaerolineaceae bacterium]
MNRNLYADDCLNVLNNPEVLPDGSVDLIYLDPPFNSNSRYNLPFKGKDKNLKPVEVFTDTWEWSDQEDATLATFLRNPQQRHLGNLIEYALTITGGRSRKNNLGAYLVNMATRLIAMKRVLSDKGSIFLHCDPTAGHYLKLILDGIYGRNSFRNEIVWCYTGPGSPKMRQFNRKHDTVFWYSFGDSWTFNKDEVRLPHKDGGPHAGGFKGASIKPDDPSYGEKGEVPETWWIDIAIAPRSSIEYLGYPTQKPIALLERIILAASNKGDLVLDPFCGCGTAMHASELLKRRWIGIDISKFSTGLVRERLLSRIPTLEKSAIKQFGTPTSVEEARALAELDRFDFEKWVCGFIGAHGMFHDPGDRGPDSGVDGVIEFYPIRIGEPAKPEYAIVQVKSGEVTPDAVGRLYATVKRLDATAGILVCFARQMRTVENNRNRDQFEDSLDAYPVIQGFSIEDMLSGKNLRLPPFAPRRKGEAPGSSGLFFQK